MNCNCKDNCFYVKELEAYNEKLLDGDIEKHNKIVELEKENAELKDKLNNLASVAEVRLANWQKLEKENKEAKELIERIIRVTWGEGWNYSLDWKVKAEQFLKDSEVEK